MNKQALLEYKVNICHNKSCQIAQDHVLPLQSLIQCPYYHGSNDKRRNPNNYKPIFICETTNEQNDFCNNIIEYLFHPKVYGTLTCIFSNLKNCQIRNCPFRHDDTTKKPFQYKICSKLFQVIESKSNLQFYKYIHKKELHLIEDQKHEFKNFREIRLDLVVNYICGFLNALGGTLYIGITDQGIIHGINLTRKQIDEFQLDLDHCLRHFDPMVLPKQVEVLFLPIFKDDLLLIPDLYIIEIRVSILDQHQLYFTHQNEAYIKRAASLNLLKPKEIKDLVISKML